MDKRYFLIMILVIVCFVNLFLVANSSDLIGKATVDVGNFMFSSPHDYNLMDSYDNYVKLENSQGITIMLFVLSNPKDNYDNALHTLQNNNNDTILSNGSIYVGDVTVNSIYYRHVVDSKVSNQAVYYFDKEGSHFKILMSGFRNDESGKNQTIQECIGIVDSLKINLKMTG